MVILKSPLEGKVTPLQDVPDAAFSEIMLGDGIAIRPTGKTSIVKSPVEGIVIASFPTNHAIVIRTSEGVEILIHYGIDTVSVGGKGLRCFVSQGEHVLVGDMLIEADNEILQEEGIDIVCPVIITSGEHIKLMCQKEVNYDSDLLMV